LPTGLFASRRPLQDALERRRQAFPPELNVLPADVLTITSVEGGA
jgi:hypothetical protein